MGEEMDARAQTAIAYWEKTGEELFRQHKRGSYKLIDKTLLIGLSKVLDLLASDVKAHLSTL